MAEATHARQPRLWLGEISRILPGLYAWAATVLLPVSQRGASNYARTLAVLALLSLSGSFLLQAGRPRAARWLGVYGFSLACLGVWALLGPYLRSDQLDPVRGALGGVGFLLHALAWGAPARSPGLAADANVLPGSRLIPRTKPVKLAPVAFGAGLGVALLPPACAFAVDDPEASLLAHAFGLGSALLIMASVADITLRLGRSPQQPSWRARAGRAVWALAGLTLALGIGLVWVALR